MGRARGFKGLRARFDPAAYLAQPSRARQASEILTMAWMARGLLRGGRDETRGGGVNERK